MAEELLIAVARAEHIRRRRLLTRVLLRAVPAAAGVLLITAALIRLAHFPLAYFWIILALAALGVAVVAWINSRVPAVTDAAAARLDDDAALDGELRSAHWFASHPEPGAGPASDPVSNEWTGYHLARAAERVEHVSWPAVYPPVKAARVWAASTIVAFGAIALVLSTAWPAAKSAGTPMTAVVSPSAKTDSPLSAELQKQLNDLIAAVQRGEIPMEAARAKVAEMRDALAKLDPKTQQALAKAAQDQAQKSGNGEPAATDPDAAALAKKAEEAAKKEDLPADMKWSMEDLAAKLAKASQKAGDAGEKSQQKGDHSASDQDPSAKQDAKDSSMSVTRAAANSTDSTQMMTTAASPMGGEKGQNGENGNKKGVGDPLDLAALRKETIEADKDSLGTNVLAEMRRKSEQSHSTLSFTRVAPLATYDKSHASAPPPPPAALRPLVRQYFIRKSGVN